MEDYYTIQTPGHHGNMFAELHTLQKQGVMCDVILAAEDGEVMAHKVVLMAASKYFREKLSPVMGPTPSKICLKGISVVELANLVKYIYTGKLLVAKETMEITLEISEILELNGVIQGYKEIITYEQMKGSTGKDAELKIKPTTETSGQGSSNVDNMTGESAEQPSTDVNQESSPNVTVSNIVTLSGSVDAVSSTSVMTQPDSNQSSKCIVSEQSDAGSTVTYQADGNKETPEVSTSQSSSDYNFETLFDQQYMDVSAGSRTPSKSQGINSPQAVVTPPKIMPMASVHTDSQKMAAERAQHQDLLAVAIETLSDVPHLKHQPHVTQPEVERAVSSISTTETDSLIPHNLFKPEEFPNLDEFENGKTTTKTVTMSAGSVSNELGGKTDVYTVALDPATVKSPLVMPRPKRSRTAKEIEAAEKAKMYRQKKAEILQASTKKDLLHSLEQDTNLGRGKRQKVATSKQDFQYESLSKTRNKFAPRILLSTKNVTEKQVIEFEKGNSVQDNQRKEGSEDRDDFGQVVNFDSDDNVEDDVDGMIADNLIAALNSKHDRKERISTEDGKGTKLDGSYIEGGSKGNDKLQAQVEMKNNKTTSKEAERSLKDKEIYKTVEHVDASSGSPFVNEENEEGNNESEIDIEYKSDKTARIHHSANISNRELSENDDEASEERIRSSATKRKTRTPRKLPLSDEEKGNESGPDRRDNIPVVRTRRSRSLNFDKQRDTNTEKSCTKPEEHTAISLESEKVTNIDSANSESTEKLISKPTEIKIVAQCNVDEKSLDEAEKLIKLSGAKKIMIVPKNLQPEIRLKKRTTDEMLKLAKDMAISAKNVSEDDAAEFNVTKVSDDDSCKGRYSKRKNDESEYSSVVKKMKIVKEMIGSKDGKQNSPGMLGSYSVCVESLKKKLKATAEIPETRGKARETQNQDKIATDGSDKGIEEESVTDTGDLEHVKTAAVGHVCPEDNVSSLRRHQAMFHEKRVVEPRIIKIKKVVKKVDHLDSTRKDDKIPQDLDVSIVKTEVSDDAVETSGGEEQNKPGQEKGTVTDVLPECTFCGKIFKSARILKKHMGYTHSDRKKLICEQCDFQTPFESSMSTHIMLKHTLAKPLLKCQYCSYETPLTGNLRKHIFATHGLFVVTKKHKKMPKYAKYEEGTILTNDGEFFDPETMFLPKQKRNSLKDQMNESESQRPTRISLNKLPVDEFLKEMMKRHEEYLKLPEKEQNFWSRSIAKATEHPSFPQASPQVRNTRADKIYNMKKLKPVFHAQTVEQSPATYGIDNLHGVDQGNVGVVHGGIPHVASEVEVTQDDQPEVVLENVEADQCAATTVLTISEQRSDDGSEMIIINQNGKQTVVRSKDFYDTLAATGQDTSQTLGVISALLQAGEQIEIREQEEVVEIQNM